VGCLELKRGVPSYTYILSLSALSISQLYFPKNIKNPILTSIIQILIYHFQIFIFNFYSFYKNINYIIILQLYIHCIYNVSRDTIKKTSKHPFFPKGRYRPKMGRGAALNVVPTIRVYPPLAGDTLFFCACQIYYNKLLLTYSESQKG
jgi:hypothetical protein